MVLSICLVFLLLSLAVSEIFVGNVLTPLGIFGMVWNGLFILFELRLVDYTTVSGPAYVMLLGSYAAFFLGAVTVYLGGKRGRREANVFKNGKQPKSPPCSLTVLYRFIRIYGIISAIGFVIWAYRLWSVGGTKVFTSAKLYRELKLGITGGGVAGWMLACGLASALLSGIYLAYGGKHRYKVWIFLLPVIGYTLITGARIGTIEAVLFLLCPLLIRASQVNTAVLVHRMRPRSPLMARKYLLWGVLVLLVVSVGVGIHRGIVQTTAQLVSPYQRVAFPEPLTHLYVYSTGCFAAFSYFIGIWDNRPALFEANLTPLAKVLQLLGVREMTAVPEFGNLWASIPFHYNVYTYLAHWYIDLGILGIFIGPYLLGALSTYLAMRFIYLHPIAFAWASFLTVYLILGLATSLTSKNEAWIAIMGTMVAVYIATRVFKVKKREIRGRGRRGS